MSAHLWHPRPLPSSLRSDICRTQRTRPPRSDDRIRTARFFDLVEKSSSNNRRLWYVKSELHRSPWQFFSCEQTVFVERRVGKRVEWAFPVWMHRNGGRYQRTGSCNDQFQYFQSLLPVDSFDVFHDDSEQIGVDRLCGGRCQIYVVQNAMYYVQNGQLKVVGSFLQNLDQERQHVETQMGVRVVKILYNALGPLETLFTESSSTV